MELEKALEIIAKQTEKLFDLEEKLAKAEQGNSFWFDKSRRQEEEKEQFKAEIEKLKSSILAENAATTEAMNPLQTQEDWA